MKTIKPLNVVFLILACGGSSAAVAQAKPSQWLAREVRPAAVSSSPVELYRPVDLVLDSEHLFILDMGDDNVKVFSKTGAFRYAFGRKGNGPGEFHRPTGLDIHDSLVYVADAGNRRIQILDKRGVYQAGFKVPFLPSRILTIEREKVIVLGIPSGRTGPEKLLHCYDAQGRILWEAVDSFHSGDSVYDLIRNRMFIRKTSGGEIWLVPGLDDRPILRMNASGFLLGESKTGEDYPLEAIAITTRGGRKRAIRPFCWHCALHGDLLYLLVPGRTEDGDLGPGRTIAVIGRKGESIAMIDLPEAVSRIAVEGDVIFGLDFDSRLRLFTVGSKK